MRILDIYGKCLAFFDPFDISSVAKAERWIKDHGLYIWKCELCRGIYTITVRSY